MSTLTVRIVHYPTSALTSLLPRVRARCRINATRWQFESVHFHPYLGHHVWWVIYSRSSLLTPLNALQLGIRLLIDLQARGVDNDNAPEP